jgi:hypothetical protein
VTAVALTLQIATSVSSSNDRSACWVQPLLLLILQLLLILLLLLPPLPPHLLPPGDPKELTYAELADLLLTLPADTAADEVSHIMARLNFTSTYAFSKLLTEQLVDDADTLPGVAKAIVRPSLIASMAGAPYPG